MRLTKYLEEMSLKPSQFRPFVKGWDKTIYNDIFDGKYRIYLELEENKENRKTNPTIEKFLHILNYEIENYAAGLAKKKGQDRVVKIGKVLKEFPKELQIFSNDPIRATSKKKDLMVVISRHPYDIAGMSTDRGWISCMDMDKCDWYEREKNVYADIKEGSLIAYLIRKDDKNINKPVARLMIRAFKHTENGNIFLIPETKIYGSGTSSFLKTVKKWISSFQNREKATKGVYALPDGVYTELKDDEYYIFPRGIIKAMPSIKNAKLGRPVIKMENGKLIWEEGYWWKGTWNNGIWLIGAWYDGIWEDGIWKNGTWHRGIWKNGIWHKGTWKNGIWHKGTWKNGVWYGGTWLSGRWIEGEIYSKKFGELKLSNVNPAIFYKLESKYKTESEFEKAILGY